MADRIDENLDESMGHTKFSGSESRSPLYIQPTGAIGKLFARFFTTSAAPEVERAINSNEMAPPTGDTVLQTDVIKMRDEDGLGAVGGVDRNTIIPQQELNRRKRYKEYEEMDEYPEISTAFDIYADDSTQKGQKGERWTVQSDNTEIVDAIEELFKQIKLDKKLWDIVRNTVKYGDCFTESIVDETKIKEGIKKIKVLNPNWMLRQENIYGHLIQFIQEVPNREQLEQNELGLHENKPGKYIKLNKHQITHFRLHTSDPLYYPYGRSIAAATHRTFRSLKMMEDAMMVYRISRAPERRIFYIDTGNLPTTKAEMFIEKVKMKFKKERYFNSTKGTPDSRYNPMSMDEDFYVPVRNGKGTKIDTLPGAQNLGEIEDVRYYRDKILSVLKIPKDYVVEQDSSPERKANLSQLDVKFARTIQRVQCDVETGLEDLAKNHLRLLGFPEAEIKDLRIFLPEPSDMSLKRKLDIDEQKTRTVAGVLELGIFPKETIYKDYYDMTDEEIEEISAKVDEEQEKMLEYQIKTEAAMAAIQVAAEPPETPQAGAPKKMAKPGYKEAGGQEGRANKTPTRNESTLDKWEARAELIQEESKREAMRRVIEKRKAKLLREASN